MKIYIRFLLFTLLLLCTGWLQAEEITGVDVFIQFYNKKIYYVGQNDIFIKITLTNNSRQTFRYNIARNKFFNLDFDVFTPTNIQLKHSDKFIIERKSHQPAFFRELSLEPGEEYGFIVELSDFVALESPGMLVIQALFYPELYMGNNPLFIKSNKLTVNVRPTVMLQDLQVLIETETGKVLERMPLPPDEVVHYMITARQRSQWEKFFLYLDLEKLYTNDSARSVEYRLSTETERLLLLEKFKQALREDRIEQEILVIPDYFQIEHTEYNATRAKVVVIQKFNYRDYTARKRYTYQLDKTDKFWLITGYIVENLGTE